MTDNKTKWITEEMQEYARSTDQYVGQFWDRLEERLRERYGEPRTVEGGEEWLTEEECKYQGANQALTDLIGPRSEWVRRSEHEEALRQDHNIIVDLRERDRDHAAEIEAKDERISKLSGKVVDLWQQRDHYRIEHRQERNCAVVRLDKIRQLEAEIAKLREDRERLEVLLKGGTDSTSISICVFDSECRIVEYITTRQAIDAAMEDSK